MADELELPRPFSARDIFSGWCTHGFIRRRQLLLSVLWRFLQAWCFPIRSVSLFYCPRLLRFRWKAIFRASVTVSLLFTDIFLCPDFCRRERKGLCKERFVRCNPYGSIVCVRFEGMISARRAPLCVGCLLQR